MKKILLFACLLASMGMYAQEIEVDHEFGNQLAHPFLQLERDRIPGGVLLDYSLGLTDLKLYDGTLRENADIDITVYSNIYKEIFMGIVNSEGEQNMQTLRQLVDQWAVYRTQTNSKETEQTTLVLSGILSNYAYIDEVAADDRNILVENNQFIDVYKNGVWQNPYKTGKAFAIGELIREERKQANLTQEELAEKIGAKKSYISRIENGKTDIQLSTLYKLIEIGLGRKINFSIQ